MTDPKDLALSIADALPNEADHRQALVALGVVTSGIIFEAAPEDRAGLVEHFCAILRSSVRGELH